MRVRGLLDPVPETAEAMSCISKRQQRTMASNDDFARLVDAAYAFDAQPRPMEARPLPNTRVVQAAAPQWKEHFAALERLLRDAVALRHDLNEGRVPYFALAKLSLDAEAMLAPVSAVLRTFENANEERLPLQQPGR